jgi:hypothetical protein
MSEYEKMRATAEAWANKTALDAALRRSSTLVATAVPMGELERLRRIEKAALVYFAKYLRDEAEELECCIDNEQHKAAQELRDALAASVK